MNHGVKGEEQGNRHRHITSVTRVFDQRALLQACSYPTRGTQLPQNNHFMKQTSRFSLFSLGKIHLKRYLWFRLDAQPEPSAVPLTSSKINWYYMQLYPDGSAAQLSSMHCRRPLHSRATVETL